MPTGQKSAREFENISYYYVQYRRAIERPASKHIKTNPNMKKTTLLSLLIATLAVTILPSCYVARPRAVVAPGPGPAVVVRPGPIVRPGPVVRPVVRPVARGRFWRRW